MAIVLPSGLTPQEIRVLQEFRRLGTDTLSLDQVKAIRHPVDGGEAPAASLVTKGYVTSNGDGITVTEKGKEFLAIEAKPDDKEASAGTASAQANPKGGEV